MQVLLGAAFKDTDESIMETTRENFMEVNGQILVKREKTGIPFTLRDASKAALLANFEDEKCLSLDEKVKRFDLYLKIKDSVDPTEATSDEIVLLKKVIGKLYGVLVVGQAVKMLEKKNEIKPISTVPDTLPG